MILTVGGARRLVTSLMEATGMPGEHAAATAEGLVLAEVWGLPSHGLLRVPSYLTRLRAGGYAATAELVTRRDTGPSVVLDGGGGLGVWQLRAAAEVAAERAGRWGIGVVAVAGSGHCGALGLHTLPGLARGLVTLVLSHGPATMPAWGGDRALLSTSPIAVGIPCRPRPAIVDLATSAISRGAIAALAARGGSLPPGCAFTGDGAPTVDPVEALGGMLAPMGGAKGFALAFAVEALTAGMVGPRLSVDVPDPFSQPRAGEPQQIAHMVVALDPAVLDPSGGGAAQSRLDLLGALATEGGGRVPGGHRRLPHEVDDTEPLDVPDDLVDGLESWSRRLGCGVAGTQRE